MAANLFFWIIVALIIMTVALILLHHAKLGPIQGKKYKNILYSALGIEIIVIVLSLIGAPLLDKIYAYRDSVLSQSEEECKRDDAPFWCNF